DNDQRASVTFHGADRARRDRVVNELPAAGDDSARLLNGAQDRARHDRTRHVPLDRFRRVVVADASIRGHGSRPPHLAKNLPAACTTTSEAGAGPTRSQKSAYACIISLRGSIRSALRL